MPDNLDKSEGIDSLESLASYTLEDNYQYYLLGNPSASREDFKTKVMNVIIQGDFTGDQALKDFQEKYAAKKVINCDLAPIYISCAYCYQCKKALESNDRESAWAAMAEARFWVGVMKHRGSIQSELEFIVKESKSWAARQAAIVRSNARYGDIKEEAYRLVRERRPASGWPSRRNAAMNIEADILVFAKFKGKALSVEQAHTTIDGWLKDMPEASTLFPGRHRKNASELEF